MASFKKFLPLRPIGAVHFINHKISRLFGLFGDAVKRIRKFFCDLLFLLFRQLPYDSEINVRHQSSFRQRLIPLSRTGNYEDNIQCEEIGQKLDQFIFAQIICGKDLDMFLAAEILKITGA